MMKPRVQTAKSQQLYTKKTKTPGTGQISRNKNKIDGVQDFRVRGLYLKENMGANQNFKHLFGNKTKKYDDDMLKEK